MKIKIFKSVRNFFLIIFIQFLRFFFLFIPWRIGTTIGKFLGYICFYFFKKEKGIIYKNLDIVYKGQLSLKEKEKFAKENFKNYGIGLVEFIKFTLWKPEKIAGLVKKVEGIEYFEKAFSEKKGIIAVTGHFSNWEIIPQYFAYKGYNIGVIGKSLFDERLNNIVNRTRQKGGVKVFDRDKISKDMIKELKNGMFLGVLVDQDTKVESKIINFLGKPAKTPVAPVLLAQKFNCYLLTLFSLRMEDGYYKIIINKPFDNIINTAVEKLAEKYNNEISAIILKYPYQWAWIHNRWKSVEEHRG
ncbi:MAG: lysophospholipid acyltransferase family protein [Candidatus Goldbacteria bacterium]|nr:lysophospholipid acyltransferase family protein [Candidatus Goldiibacteriota bacterium]